MKRKLTLLLLAASAVISVNAQVMIQENFTSPFNPNTNGWNLQNLTATAGGNWFQGNGAVFPAYNGAANDYIGVNYASSTNTTSGETLSNWLITPVVTLNNGGILEFATRTSTNPATFPDRLEVYMSTAGNGVNVGNTPTSLGTFSTLLVSVNPSLTTTGYPGVWTVYSVTLTGLSGPITGRFGFRYHVTNGGPATSAANSNYVGLDAVKYWIPCGATVQSYTICSGGSATLNAVGAVTPATYTWNPGNLNTQSIVVNPTSTTIYTLSYAEGTNTPCADQTATITVGSALSVSVSASANTVCAQGGTVTLTANAAAANYSWSTGATTSTINVSPGATTIYTVAAYNGIFPAITCAGANTIQVNVVQNPTVTAAVAPTLVCQGTNYTLTGSGATDYLWLLSSTTGSNLNPLALTAGAAGPRSYTLFGATAGCTSAGVPINFTVNPTPTVTASAAMPTVCAGNSVLLTASGASTYTWSGSGSSTSNPFNYTAPSVGVKTFTVVGNDNGCTASATVAVTATVCIDGIADNAGVSNAVIYPNPFTNEIKVSELEGSVKVYNALGQMIIASEINNSGTLNTTELPKGIYTVKAYNTDGHHVKTTKLLKN
jgi:hypothetical protein